MDGAAAETVEFQFDGALLEGRPGDTIAAALLAAGIDLFSRSLKYHRPRGPYCLSGRCSHCLVRVDGVPDVVACTTPLAEGMRVEVQNSFPSAQHDVLRAIDWLFPKGLDHHAMFAGVRVVEGAVAAVARHIAGLGPLPDRIGLPGEPLAVRRCDLAIVGAGPSGLALAHAVRRSGLSVELLEERAQVGGRLCARLDVETSDPDIAWASQVAAECARDGVRLSLGTAVIAAYREGTGRALLLRSEPPSPLTLLEAREIAFCNGAVEPLWPFEGNDLPGVFAGRGLARFVQERRVLPGHRVVVVGSGSAALALAQLLARAGAPSVALVDPSGALEASEVRLWSGYELKRARGQKHLRAVELTGSSGARRLPCDLLALIGALAPSIELARQAGARAAYGGSRGGYFIEAREGLTGAEGIYAAGDLTGIGSAREALDAGEALGIAIAERARRAGDEA